MGLPDPSEMCAELDIDIEFLLNLAIELPGGAAITFKFEPGTIPSFSGAVSALLDQLAPALTPLVPLFRLIDAIIAIFEFCKAIPDSLGPPPDPTLLVKRLVKLVKAMGFVLKLIPPLSIPIMIVSICKLIVAVLKGLVEQIGGIITVQAKLDASADLAAELALDPDTLQGALALQASLDCAQANLDLQFEVSMKGLGPVGKFIDLLNIFMSIIGLPEIGKVEAGGDPTAVLAPLNIAITALETLCGQIPV